jgi:hypothetical protein
VKTGYNGKFTKATGPMLCFDNTSTNDNIIVNNSPLEQAILQLVTTAIMFLKMYPYVERINLWVIWMSETEITRYSVDARTYLKYQANLLKYFFKHQN